MTKQVLYVVLPETAPVSFLDGLFTECNYSFRMAVASAIRLSMFAEREKPECTEASWSYRIFECESGSRLRQVGYTVKTSGEWIVTLS